MRKNIFIIVMSIVLSNAFTMERDYDEEGLLDPNQSKLSVLSGLVKKNKMVHLRNAALGGAVMYGGSKLIEHVNLKQENPSELVKEHKKEIAMLLTGIGIVGGFSITLMSFGEKRGAKKNQLLIIKQYENEIETVWSIENRLTDEEKEAETRVLMRLLKQAIEKYKAM